MSIIIKAFLLVVAAEMGDKTQLLAMALAGKYKASQVMLGVLIATILNHGIAVAVGSYLNHLIPINIVRIVSAIAFLIFGLWTLRGDKIDDDKKSKSSFSPVLTVVIAFFLAEMGDKTQLMTITISAQSNQPILILMGTTMGMLVADGIGIIGGAWMCKHIPEIYIKWAAGIVFILFGTIIFKNSVPMWMISPVYILSYIVLLGISIYLFGIKFSNHSKVCTIKNSRKAANNK